MEILKIGHACITVKTKDVTFLVDPGKYSRGQLEVHGIDAILITHAHHDHIDPKTFPEVIKNNPDAEVYTNGTVGNVLDELHIAWKPAHDGDHFKVKGVSVSVFSQNHHSIHRDIPTIENTGFLIDKTLFHPGDDYLVPPVKVAVLAAPFAAPWGTLGGSIDYVKEIGPKTCFPIHDGMLKTYGPFHFWPQKLLPKEDITFIPLVENETLTV